MLNYRIIARAFAGLIGLEGLLFMVCWLVGIGYGEHHHSTWLIPIGICAALSVILGLLGGKGPTRVERRDGFFIVPLRWAPASGFGSFFRDDVGIYHYGIDDLHRH